ncbi:hypothetical protein BGZ74_006386 [Mortierella antarctica]|nr:hypothetical protein BGZ74_006386 [Mortierella antarctica]
MTRLEQLPIHWRCDFVNFGGIKLGSNASSYSEAIFLKLLPVTAAITLFCGLDSLDIHNPYYSWVDMYQIADNFGLE